MSLSRQVLRGSKSSVAPVSQAPGRRHKLCRLCSVPVVGCSSVYAFAYVIILLLQVLHWPTTCATRGAMSRSLKMQRLLQSSSPGNSMLMSTSIRHHKAFDRYEQSRTRTGTATGTGSRSRGYGYVPPGRTTRSTGTICESISTTALHFAPLSLDDLSVGMYDAQLWASTLVEDRLSTVNPLSFLALYGAGLLTAFSPCVMGFLPITIAYLGFDSDSGSDNSRVSKAIFYAIGLASVLCSFGVAAAMAGQAVGQSSPASSSLQVVANLAVATLTIAMGLKLLDLVEFALPSFDTLVQNMSSSSSSDTDNNKNNKNQQWEALLLGAGTALIAEPCTSPVLASLLAVISASGNPVSGAFFLFAYSLGYVTPVISCGVLYGSVIGTGTGTETGGMGALSLSVSGIAQKTSWVNELFASLLIAFGTYKLLDVFTRIV